VPKQKTDDEQREEDDRRSFVSVAVSFGDLKMLERLGSGVVEVTCPECGARGRRFGDVDDEFRFEGFEPLTKGGLKFILCECTACKKHVTLPHPPLAD
jgi:hypothetical protein